MVASNETQRNPLFEACGTAKPQLNYPSKSTLILNLTRTHALSIPFSLSFRFRKTNPPLRSSIAGATPRHGRRHKWEFSGPDAQEAEQPVIGTSAAPLRGDAPSDLGARSGAVRSGRSGLRTAEVLVQGCAFGGSGGLGRALGWFACSLLGGCSWTPGSGRGHFSGFLQMFMGHIINGKLWWRRNCL